MATIEQLQERHQALEKAAASNPEGVRLGQIKNFAAQVSEVGRTIEDEAQRQTLQTILSHWAGFVQTQSGETISEELDAFQASVTLEPEPPPPPPTPSAATPTPYPETRTNRSAPPEWLVRGIMVLVIAALAIGGYFILQNFFEGDDTTTTDAATPTLEATTIAIIEEAQVTPQLPTATPTAIVVQVIATDVPAEEIVETAVPAESNENVNPVRTHAVNANDSLFTIARRYGITIEEIIASNDLADPNRLEIGQELIIPFPGQAITPTAEATALPPPTEPPLPTETPRPAVTPEVVIRTNDLTAVVSLFLAPDPNSEIVATLSQGTFALAIGLSEDRGWYLIELNNGQARGWVTVQDAALLSPATPDDLPLLRVVENP
ncbi:MAG: LysM peptidoglycan-binding domain-containing protein [Chloroflexota bacterium]